MGLDNWLLVLDEQLTHILGQWDIYSTFILTAIIVLFGWQIFTRRDPDTHPMLLARQSQPSVVRHEGQSSVFRAHAAPHGMELNAGLNVKDEGTSKWARGRNGDLRDVWRKIATGAVDKDGNKTGEKGRIITVLGRESIDHDLNEISRQINIIGQYVQHEKGSRVAIYLPNSIELLAALFACSFYDLTPVVLPYDQPSSTIIGMLRASKADSLVAAVGSVPFDAISKSYPALKQLIWVTDSGSKHMDWNEIPKGSGGSINVSTWQEIVEDHKSTSSELPTLTTGQTPKALVTFWQSSSGDVGQMTEYTQANLVSAMSAQIAAIPLSRRIGPSDLIFPADSLSTIYTLVVTLAAAYYNASLVLNSVAGPKSDLILATQSIAPTIVIASPESLVKLQQETTVKISSSFLRAVHWLQTRTLTQNGVMPVASVISQFNDSRRPVIGSTPGKLRLIFAAERAGGSCPPLSSSDLSDLRIFTGARIIYALTVAQVAGAVTQTAFYDYRVDEGSRGKHSHFGAPVSSVEVSFKDTRDKKTTDSISAGEIVVAGPAVVGGHAALGVTGLMREDLTLAYA